MRFWDSSALVPLVVPEGSSPRIEGILDADRSVTVWCLSHIEVWGAVARKRRALKLGSPDVRRARIGLAKLRDDWTEVQDFAAVCARAIRILDVHPLRTADALQLAAALVLVSDRPERFPFVTLDDRLGEAAELEGFEVQGLEAAPPA